jgi:hypothetical protein
MTDFYHNIADIIFRTQSDTEIRCIQNGSFKKFHTEEHNYNVNHKMTLFVGNNNSLPPLTKSEQKSILKCVHGNCIDRSTLIIPPIIQQKANFEISMPVNGDYFDFYNPILQSESVRKKLERCFSTPNQIKIQLHRLSITIYDYINRTINIFYAPECKEIIKSELVNNGIQRMFTSFLPTFSAAMIHSSALLINEKIGLFLAPDGGGKTTATKLGSKYPVLSDDQNILRKINDNFIAYSTPWGNHINCKLEGSLKGIFLLIKGNEFKLKKLKSKSIFLYLWKEHLPYSRSLPKNSRFDYFTFLLELSNTIQGYQLTFPRDYIDWTAIENEMQ